MVLMAPSPFRVAGGIAPAEPGCGGSAAAAAPAPGRATAAATAKPVSRKLLRDASAFIAHLRGACRILHVFIRETGWHGKLRGLARFRHRIGGNQRQAGETDIQKQRRNCRPEVRTEA